jgi:hypothetical protein
VSYTIFTQKMILALYRESDGDTEKQVNFDSLPEKYGIVVEKDFWLKNLITEWSQQGIAHFQEGGLDRQNFVAINIPGVRMAESLSTAILPEVTKPMVDQALMSVTSSEPSIVFHPAIDSSSWTGIETRLSTDPKTVAAIVDKIAELDRLVENTGLTNHEKARAKAITQALGNLVESPEPEWKAIVGLLQSPALAASLNLAALVQLILKLFGIG